ncbi:MAG: sigma-54 dependent transcriptional regulator [Planctomycetota bacterium]|nr:sigma-54 dependent transcriptional regulator [Planctomycetota bacterium]
MSNTTQHKLRVLFVDDEESIANVMRIELPHMGHDTVVCEDGDTAIASLKTHTFDAAIVDLRMPGTSGWDVIEQIKKQSPETEVVISTGHGDMDDAIRAIREGAYDFLPKPSTLAQFSAVLNRIGEKQELKNKNIALESRLKAVQGETRMVGESAPMQRVTKLIERVAPTDSSVLILGETGTGKELVARRIHDLSLRASKAFVAVNCGALPENLVESEFFGHRKGAFTGAETARKGLFEVANGGTLFLDELGELDRSMQVKLLRFLESGEVRRVGENEAFHVDVRIVCATNRDLQDMVDESSFREDLFFRVNTFEIHLPPLRERQADIPALTQFLVARHLKRSDVPANFITPEAQEVLMQHGWSGNVRELANVIEHAVILSDGDKITPEDLPSSVLRHARQRNNVLPFADRDKTLREVEMEMIHHVLAKHDGDKPKTASELGIALKTLYNKLNQYQSSAG